MNEMGKDTQNERPFRDEIVLIPLFRTEVRMENGEWKGQNGNGTLVIISHFSLFEPFPSCCSRSLRGAFLNILSLCRKAAKRLPS